MGKEKDEALGKKVHNRDIDKIDQLAFELKNATTKEERQRVQGSILEYFDSYLEKYVNLFVGANINLMNYDTRGFLGMFLTGREKSAENLATQKTYIVKVLSRLTREEIKAELVLIFLNVLNRYDIIEGVNALNPLTRWFKWRLKDWFNRLVKDPLFKTIDPVSEDGKALERIIDARGCVEPDLNFEARMDLKWILDPGRYEFKQLTRYERYLLALVYQQNISLADVAIKLERDKDTIKRHLKMALSKLNLEEVEFDE